MAENIKIRIVTPTFRMLNSTLVVPRRFKNPVTKKETGEPKYGLTMLYAKADMDKFNRPSESGEMEQFNISTLCMQIAKNMWYPNDAGDETNPTCASKEQLSELFPKKKNKPSAWPIRVGNKLIELEAAKDKPRNVDYLKDMYQISASSKEEFEPVLSYREKGKIVKLDRSVEADVKVANKLFTNGSYAFAELTVSPFTVDENNFITFYLNQVRFVKPGDRIGGGGGLMDRFDGVNGGESDIDPTENEEFE